MVVVEVGGSWAYSTPQITGGRGMYEERIRQVRKRTEGERGGRRGAGSRRDQIGKGET